MISEVLYSSRTEEWPTPQSFFDQLDAEFHFTLDPCATAENAKCATYFTKEQDGLAQHWGMHTAFCNPPYGKHMREWARKCYEASLGGATVVMLAHSRTDTRWFHDWVYGKAELRFVRRRLKFGGGKQSAPFPSLVAVYRPPTIH
jgi:phage N-6-adenine-methyltransferase